MKKSLLRRMARFLRPYGIRILVILAVILAANLLALAKPYGVSPEELLRSAQSEDA